MGTRNLTMVIHNAETKVAQYGQWDGYPDGQGATALAFLRSVNMDAFKERLSRVRFVDDVKQAEIDAFLLSIGCTDEWMNMAQANEYKSRYPLFSRDNGAKVLQMIMDCDDEQIYLYDNSAFAADSLMCEWAYVLDLDNNTFEVYQGFNKSPLEQAERFASLSGKDGYYPVKLVKAYTLDALPESTNAFVNEINALTEAVE